MTHTHIWHFSSTLERSQLRAHRVGTVAPSGSPVRALGFIARWVEPSVVDFHCVNVACFTHTERAFRAEGWKERTHMAGL